MSSYRYRKIWEKANGPIPKDTSDRTYEIHHLDGNHNNNDLANLVCIPIEEHYKLHYERGDWGACVMIARRMNLPPEYISDIQKGKKRPGIGGVKKGTKPWNAGKTGYKLSLTTDGMNRKKQATKNAARISDHDASAIRQDFINRIELKSDKLGKKQGNGKYMTYERAFCIEYAVKYNISDQYVYRIIKGKVKIV